MKKITFQYYNVAIKKQHDSREIFSIFKWTILRHLMVVWVVALLMISCSSDDDFSPLPGGGTTPPPNPNDPNTWLIPVNRIVDGGPGKDGIPSIDNPQFSQVSDIDFLQPSDLVLGIDIDGDIRAYPHPILDWHEIVNDVVGNTPLAVTYCPLTGTGTGWDRVLNGRETTFGVSGLLYNSNLIPYDRDSDSNWSQMLLKSVNGVQVGTEIETIHLIETTWATWRQMFPNSNVLNLNTGFQRDYSQYPYGSFRTNNNFLLFSVEPDDPRLPRKERGLGVLVDGDSRFYSLESFSGTSDVTILQDALSGKELVVAGSKDQNFIVAYSRRLEDGTLLTFESYSGDSPEVIMTDNEGNQWNLFGEAVEGPRRRQRLTPVNSFMGYWFAWGAFYPGIQIFE